MADSLEYILACQICLEDFEEAGDHVPRILPCSHSLCEKCLIQLIQGNFINSQNVVRDTKLGIKKEHFHKTSTSLPMFVEKKKKMNKQRLEIFVMNMVKN